MFKDGIKHLLYGLGIGVANLIPGVSGGTMAVVLGIYDRLISAISDFFTDQEKRWSAFAFLSKIGIGAVVGVLVLAKFIAFAITAWPNPSYLFFMGLILGSIPVVYRAHPNLRFGIGNILAFGLPFLAMIALALVSEPGAEGHIAKLSLGTVLFLGLSGLIAAGTMVVPGVSGSFILLLMGSYHPIVQAVSDRNLTVIGIVGLGAMLGIVVVSKAINWALRYAEGLTYSAILGLMVGSLPKLWPGTLSYDLSGLIGLLFFVLGIALALGFQARPSTT